MTRAEVFEREYSGRQISRFGGNISRTAEFVGMERSGIASQTQGPRNRLAIQCRASHTSMVVICRASAAKVAVEDRGYQSADGVYEVCEVRGGRLVDERRHMARLDRSLGELRIVASRCRMLRWRSCCAKRSGATGCAMASSMFRLPAAWRDGIFHFRWPVHDHLLVVTARNSDQRSP